MTKKFTEKFVTTIKLKPSERNGRGYCDYYDSETKGLSLRVGKRGKVYYFENKAINVSKTRLGSTQEISLDRARFMAGEFLKVHNDEMQSYSALTLEQYIEKVYQPSVEGAAEKLRKMTGIDEKLLSMKMVQVRITDIEAWKARRLKQKSYKGTLVKPSTAKREYNTLRSVFSHAFKSDHIPFNKVGGVTFEGIDDSYREAFTDLGEVKRVFDCVQKHGSPTLRLLWNLMLHTGGRPKELLSAKESDIREDGTLFVHASHSKTGESRSISLSHPAKRILNEWLASNDYKKTFISLHTLREADAFLNGEEYKQPTHTLKAPLNKERYLFWNNTSEKPIESLSNSYRRLVNKYKDEYGFRDNTLYVLRHTFATQAISKAPIDTVRELLGHKTVTTTQIYLTQDTEKLELTTNAISEDFEFTAPEAIDTSNMEGVEHVQSIHKPQSFEARKEMEQIKKLARSEPT